MDASRSAIPVWGLLTGSVKVLNAVNRVDRVDCFRVDRRVQIRWAGFALASHPLGQLERGAV